MVLERQPIHSFVFWTIAGVNDDGQKTFDSKLVSAGRFVYGKQAVQTAFSDQQEYDGMLTDTDRRIPIGSIIYKGTRAQFEADVLNSDIELYEVVDIRITEDIKGRNVRYNHAFVRYKNQSPEPE